ncbi:hypothetical protein GQ54DRAFT_336667 [Martensiomyces pterosporus]|nr:hypothetical protein GQ54DRAFT_336667 [Martensiomyces pterosporus]
MQCSTTTILAACYIAPQRSEQRSCLALTPAPHPHRKLYRRQSTGSSTDSSNTLVPPAPPPENKAFSFIPPQHQSPSQNTERFPLRIQPPPPPQNHGRYSSRPQSALAHIADSTTERAAEYYLHNQARSPSLLQSRETTKVERRSSLDSPLLNAADARSSHVRRTACIKQQKQSPPVHEVAAMGSSPAGRHGARTATPTCDNRARAALGGEVVGHAGFTGGRDATRRYQKPHNHRKSSTGQDHQEQKVMSAVVQHPRRETPATAGRQYHRHRRPLQPPPGSTSLLAAPSTNTSNADRSKASGAEKDSKMHGILGVRGVVRLAQCMPRTVTIQRANNMYHIQGVLGA